MKTYFIAKTKNLRGTAIIILLTVSGMMMSSCLKEDSIIPATKKESTTTVNDASQRNSANQFSVELPLIYVEHTGGFRGIPQYNFAVYQSGKIIYTGVRNVGIMGKKVLEVSSNEVNKVAEFIIEQGFLEMEDKYPYLCDASQHITILQGDIGRTSAHKTVIDYSIAVPAELLLIRKTLEDKLGITALVNAQSSQTAFDKVSQ